MSGSQKWEQEQLFSLDQPSLKALSYLLRHKELWPQGFEWNYSECDTCAMGLASELWGWGISKDTPVFVGLNLTVSKLKMDRRAACTIFGDAMTYYRATRTNGRITPEMVANKIDKYLESGSSFLRF